MYRSLWHGNNNRSLKTSFFLFFNMKNKKGDIWISAIIYIALGIVILSIVLAAGIPVINKMKDSYTAKQTKEIMLTLDQNIRSVNNHGPGAQTQLKLKINKGDLEINPTTNIISWGTRTKAVLSEPDVPINEGNLQILTNTSIQKGEYDLYLSLEYDSTLINLTYTGETLKGTNILSITNIGGGQIQITKI